MGRLRSVAAELAVGDIVAGDRGALDAARRIAVVVDAVVQGVAVVPHRDRVAAPAEAQQVLRPQHLGEQALQPREALAGALLAELAGLDDAAFRRLFSGSAAKRLGRDRFVRNVLIAIGNSGDAVLAEAARARLDDASPLVRAMAAWALSRLLPPAEFRRLAATRREPDPEVRAEWAGCAA